MVEALRPGVADTRVLLTVPARSCKGWSDDLRPFHAFAADRGTLALLARPIAPPTTLDGVGSARAVAFADDGAVEEITPYAPAPRFTMSLPRTLERAAPRRVASFLAGRYCAAAALGGIRGALSLDVGVGLAGAPSWPDGFVGSITHTSRLAVAVVAARHEALGVGIDCEEVLTAPAAAEIAHVVIPEVDRAAREGIWPPELDWPTFVTLAFSAKESVYKCVHPLVGVFFEFHAVHIVAVGDGRLRLRLTRTLGRGFERGRELEATYVVANGHVHTAVVLPATRRVTQHAGAQFTRRAASPEEVA